MKIYQLKAKGKYKYFENEGTIFSKKVFTNIPTDNDIDEFYNKCINSEYELMDLDEETKITGVELELIDNK